jgi:hypothetical protein
LLFFSLVFPPVSLFFFWFFFWGGQGLSSIDQQRGIYYIIGTASPAMGPRLTSFVPLTGTNLTSQLICLIGISTVNGSVLTEFALPFLLEAFVGVGQYVWRAPGEKMRECMKNERRKNALSCSYALSFLSTTDMWTCIRRQATCTCAAATTSPTSTVGNFRVTASGRHPSRLLSVYPVLYRVYVKKNKIVPIARVGDTDLIEVLGGVSCLDEANNVYWVWPSPLA